MLGDRLAQLGATHVDLPAHDGLWQAADATKHNLLARLAIAPLVLEARGLDVTPAMIEKLTNVGDLDSAAALNIIMTDEVGHVTVGKRLFDFLHAGWTDLTQSVVGTGLSHNIFMVISNHLLTLLRTMLPDFHLLFSGHLPNAMM